MWLEFFKNYSYVIYSIVGWSYILLFIGWKDLKRLYPMAILGGLILFGASYWLIENNLYKFNISFLPILTIPFAFILWGASSGIIFVYYFKPNPIRRFLMIIGFSALVVLLEYFAESVKIVEHIGEFNDWDEFIFDTFMLSTLAFLITNFFKKRIEQA
jgi:hypothetical protein